ncbi:hypothetical protein LguiB_017790 [Lonicera macranthoides]
MATVDTPFSNLCYSQRVITSSPELNNALETTRRWINQTAENIPRGKASIYMPEPPVADVLKGMFTPKLSGHGATGDAIALLSDACRYYLIESGFALFVAFLINVSVIFVSGAVCSAENLSEDDVNSFNDLTLNSAYFLLKNVLGKSSSTVYAIALLASGQSSTITGTYAGQYVMQIIVFSSLLGLGIIGINIYYLSTAFVDQLIHNNLPKVGYVFLGIIVFALMAIYILMVLYLMFRKDVVVTFIDTTKVDHAQASMEKGRGNSDVTVESTSGTYREDFVDISFPP